jgi:hypothetical protein
MHVAGLSLLNSFNERVAFPFSYASCSRTDYLLKANASFSLDSGKFYTSCNPTGSYVTDCSRVTKVAIPLVYFFLSILLDSSL